MERKKVYRLFLILILVLNILTIFYLYIKKIDRSIPNNIKLIVNEDEQFDLNIPIQANIDIENSIGAWNVNNNKIPKNQINLDFNKSFTLSSSELGNYKMNLKLFGFINFKNINIDVIEQTKLIPCGNSIGIYIETKGILVLGTSSVLDTNGIAVEPAVNILKSGDYIIKANNIKVKTKEDLMKQINKCKDDKLILNLLRDEEEIKVAIKPVKTSDGTYKIGTWIRDDTQGIGTLTYISENGQFGALGHGVTDIDTSTLLTVGKGNIYNADIINIVKGKSGEPGELIGYIDKAQSNILGDIKENTTQGIFGVISDTSLIDKSKLMNIGLKQEIEIGEAYILCSIDNNLQEYKIEIEDIDLQDRNKTKGMVIKIIDERLISETNGIVQGMSGSPIIQNNKIIGAITHVFVKDPLKGYATFIENML